MILPNPNIILYKKYIVEKNISQIVFVYCIDHLDGLT